MSTSEKVALIRSISGDYSLSAALGVLGLPKSTWYYRRHHDIDYQEKYAHLQPLLEQVARSHPAYGYRRTTTELHETYKEQVNHKVVQRLHQLWGLALLRTTHSPKPSGIRKIIVAAGSRVNIVAQLEKIEPLDLVYTDFTELRYVDGTQKAYMMPIIGHASKFAFGWAVGENTNRALALKAWTLARETMRRFGIEPAGMIMHHDQDPVYTSYAWTGRLLLQDQLRISYALDGAKDNPEMESFNSRFKNENRSLLLDAPTVEMLAKVVNERMNYHNDVRRHSALSNQSPRKFLERWLSDVTRNLLLSEPSLRTTIKPEK
jgi:putative transposase